MPKLKKKRLSKLDNLGKNLTSLNDDIEVIKRKDRAKKEARKKHSHKPSRMIPRPKGRPGRQSGYSIIEAMQLADHKSKYNTALHVIRSLVVRYLDTSRTLTQQKDRLLVEKVIVKAQQDVPFLKRYEGGWAVRDIMAQFLRNRALRDRKLTKELKIKSSNTSVAQKTVQKKKRLQRDVSDLESSDEADIENGEESDDETDNSASEKESDGESNARTDEESNAGTNDESEMDIDTENDESVPQQKQKRTSTATIQLPSKEQKNLKGKSRDVASRAAAGVAGPRDVPPRKRRYSSDDDESPVSARSLPKKRKLAHSLPVTREPQSNVATLEDNEVVTTVAKRAKSSVQSKMAPRSNPRPAIQDETRTMNEGMRQANTTPEPDSTTKGKSKQEIMAGDTTDNDEDDFHIPGLTTSEDEMDGNGKLVHCPGYRCKDPIPSPADTLPELAATINSYMEMRKQKGRDTVFRWANEVCTMIKKNKVRLTKRTDALNRGWPVTTVDFKRIPHRIVGIYDVLKQLVFSQEFRERVSCVWGSFEADLEEDHWTIERFTIIKPSKVSPNSATAKGARTGYYGLKGGSIILHTLINLFPPERTPDDGFKPLSHAQFFRYFMVPHVAATLIAQDLNSAMLKKGHECMLLSSDLGELEYPLLEDDGEEDEIYRATLFAFRRLGRKGGGWNDEGREQVIPTEEDVTNAANLLLQLKERPREEQATSSRPLPRMVQRRQVNESVAGPSKLSSSKTTVSEHQRENTVNNAPTGIENANPKTDRGSQKKRGKGCADGENQSNSTKKHNTRSNTRKVNV